MNTASVYRIMLEKGVSFDEAEELLEKEAL